MTRTRKNRKQKSEQIALQKYLIRWQHSERIIGHAVKWGSFSFIGYMSYLAISELAGKTTLAEISAAFSWPSGPEWYIVKYSN